MIRNGIICAYWLRGTCRSVNRAPGLLVTPGTSMESESARNEKWTLTRESLEVFLNYLDADRERAGEKYETIRQKLLTLFRCNGCWTAEDLADETIDRVI